MRVLFVDVGQGTCQIILLGEGRAIVIDAGAHDKTAHRILKLNKIHTIELLAVSHSHSDHAGGVVRKKSVKRKGRKKETCATGILVDFKDSIRQIGFVQDSNFLKSKFGQYVVGLIKKGILRENQLIRLERTAQYLPLWPADATAASDTVLACISPTAAGNVVANMDGNVNASSAIIEMRHRTDRIIFTGDSEYAQWDSLVEHRKQNGIDEPIKAVAITMPHHGGLMHGTAADLGKFANETTEAEVVVFSVGTTNGHKHPRPEVIEAMKNAGAHVVCTQITKQCCANLESIRPGVTGPLVIPCRSSSKPEYSYKQKMRDTKKVRLRRSRNVACAGSVEAVLDDEGIKVLGLEKHTQGVNQLVANGHTPLCRV